VSLRGADKSNKQRADTTYNREAKGQFSY